MYIGTLKQVVDPDIFSLLNEDYNYYLIEESSPENAEEKVNKFVKWLYTQNFKSRSWLLDKLHKLNKLSAKYANDSETDPRLSGQSTLNKIKEKIKRTIARAIVWVTNQLSKYTKPEHDENGKFINIGSKAESINNKKFSDLDTLDKNIATRKSFINNGDNDRMRRFIITKDKNYEKLSKDQMDFFTRKSDKQKYKRIANRYM